MKNYLSFGLFIQAIAIGLVLFFSACDHSEADMSPSNPDQIGVGGSMARFTITRGHLYVVETDKLHVYDLADPFVPAMKNVLNIGDGIETIYPYGEHLFIGSQTSMMIYNISDPASPKRISTYTHLRACDPVVVNDKYAFVTLRNGTECRRSVNRLEILDISDLRFPKKIFEYDMINPHGLGIDGNNLFICEGKWGLKVFDIETPNDIKLLQHIENIETFDVIPRNNVLMVVGKSGLHQYDYTNPAMLEFLSSITVD